MSRYIQAVDAFGLSRPNAIAFANSAGQNITFGELKHYSDAIAKQLAAIDPTCQPVVVYGHKSPLMIASFLACTKSGRAYVPGDTIYPDLRIADILDQLEQPIVINTTDRDLLSCEELKGHMGACYQCEDLLTEIESNAAQPMKELKGDEIYYILFTSGSTGRPKGVEITAECIDNFWDWMSARFSPDRPGNDIRDKRILFNRAPFTFDVSMGDMAMSIGVGDTMFALAEEDEDDLGRAFEAFAQSDVNVWSSTPTFVEMCLRDKSFSPDLLPKIDTFILAGEALKSSTVLKLHDRFPGCEVINAYGPTESTDLVSTISITREMAESGGPMPIGFAKTGTELMVLNPETLEVCKAGETGELFIVGNTVAKGYYQRPDLTDIAFGVCPEKLARGRRSYRTGDAVYANSDGCVYYHGRLDFQVKLHGYRLELGEIESALMRIDGVASACVLPVERNETISHLVAFVVAPGIMDDIAQGKNDAFDVSQAYKDELRGFLPEYMIPRKVTFLAEMPLGVSGKVDRARLRELL